MLWPDFISLRFDAVKKQQQLIMESEVVQRTGEEKSLPESLPSAETAPRHHGNDHALPVDERFLLRSRKTAFIYHSRCVFTCVYNRTVFLNRFDAVPTSETPFFLLLMHL